MNLPSNQPPSPHRVGWPYVICAVLSLAIQQGWSPTDVRQLAIVVLVLLALVYCAQP
ncbi:hypothetical protein [Streptomyces sp. NPDC057257]|uniref:hypothetical protein n=1 Tax=Streptomyces sp. NPDC057257 TaxID=3346071 RepID=UPI003628C2D9